MNHLSYKFETQQSHRGRHIATLKALRSRITSLINPKNFSFIVDVKFNHWYLKQHSACVYVSTTKSRQTTSCAVKHFCIANSNLWKTTFIDLGNIILLCITFWTLFKRFTASNARKAKISNANDIKMRWLPAHALKLILWSSATHYTR
jgi:hypothetical protein